MLFFNFYTRLKRFILILSVLLTFHCAIYWSLWMGNSDGYLEPGEIPFMPQNDTDCILPILNPWHSSMKKIYSKYMGKKRRRCEVTLNQMTSLVDGHLKVNWEPSWFSWLDPLCRYRCLLPKDDWNMTEGEWQHIDKKFGAKPNCDIIETQCKKYFYFSHRFIHTQFVEKPSTVNLAHNLSEYNFYWIIIDSTSNSMFNRAMIETRKVLLEKMGAIEFPYLNKIGLNSRPNANAMLLGIEAKEGDACQKAMDNLSFVAYDFRDEGFRTMMSEDWDIGVFSWPDCIGFKTAPVDHSTRPFWFKIGRDFHAKYIDKALRHQLNEKSCKTYHHYLLEHLLKFDDSYKGKPKFVIEWITSLAHGHNSDLFPADHDFAEFFEQMNEKSKNSFLFFQSDHGMRFDEVSEVPILGEIENNNPFLYVVVPEKLKKNPTLMGQLRKNSKHLVSHFDLHASAVQVAKFSHKWDESTNFKQQPEPIPKRNFLGSSIFHQMTQARTCANLNIPQKYCLCQYKIIKLNDKKLAEKMAQSIIGYINEELDKSEHKDLCLRHTLSHDYPIELEEIVVKENSDGKVLRVKFETMPGKALYFGRGELHKNGSISLGQSEFPRLNSYEKQAICIPESFSRNYCVCKN